MDKNVSWKQRLKYYSKKENIGKISNKTLREIIGQTIYKSKDFHKIKLYNDLPFIISSKDKGLSLDLFVFKIREKSACKYFLSILNKNDIVFDLGANIGYYVIQEAKIVKKVIAIEPSKNSFELLKKNIHLNNLNNVEYYNIAIGDKNKLIDFYVYECANVSSVKPLEQHGDYKIEKTKMVKGKGFFKSYNNYPTVLRMDVEGYELEILKSFKDDLKFFKKFFFEVHTVFLGKQGVIELLGLVEQNGFDEIGFMNDDKYTGKIEPIKYFAIKDFKEYDFPECFHLFGVKK